MSAIRKNHSGWEVKVDHRTFMVSLAEDGIHFEEVDSGTPGVSHKTQVLTYSDALSKAEHQLTLL